VFNNPGEKAKWTCYPRISPGPLTGPTDGIGPGMQWVCTYTRCKGGKLQAHEICVPGTVKYVTEEQCTSGSGWSYPMSESFALTQLEDITGEWVPLQHPISLQ